MITKAEILQLPKGAYTDTNGNLVVDNKFKIYIPIFRRAGESKDSKLSASIMYATLMYNPGCENGYKVGDVVYVSFENNQMGKPVILGKLYLNKANESSNSSYIVGDNLSIVKTATLPLSTTIGSIKGEELEKLFQTVANNSNLVSQKSSLYMHFICVVVWNGDGENISDECKYSFLLPTTSKEPITTLNELKGAMPITDIATKRFPVTPLTTSTCTTFNGASIYKNSSNVIYLVNSDSSSTKSLEWWSNISIDDSVIG